MLTVYGDITTATSGLILQQVNCQGVMGSGVAKALRDKWPVVYERYMHRHETSHLGEGGAELLGISQMVQVEEDLWVCNLFGQQYYGRTGAKFTSYDALDTALRRAGKWCKENHIKMIHYPIIGCGLGGGHWPVVQSLIQQHIGEYEQTLWLQ